MQKNIFRKLFFRKIKIVKKSRKNNISGPQNGQNIESFRKLINFKPGTSQEDHL